MWGREGQDSQYRKRQYLKDRNIYYLPNPAGCDLGCLVLFYPLGGVL